ncbi:MAG: ABC transporter ATP-binding protein [Clostridia bacterium]|nr:ABC transporter ATP-binding protein [Clostridia bacterium]
MKIELNNLTFSYKKRSAPVLEGVGAVFEQGKRYALTGRNGSGKTTLANLILGLLKPQNGNILINGEDAAKMSAALRAKKIGYLFQNPDLQLFAPTVMEELAFPFELTGTLTEEKQDELQRMLTIFHLNGMEERFPLTMSGGEKQRLALATVMSRHAEFLILDEPTSAIDRECRSFLTNFINGFAGGALVITHDEELIASLDSPHLLKLEGGRVHEA